MAIHKNSGPLPSKEEVQQKLDAVLEAARKGSISPDQAVIKCESITFSIKEARKYLGLPDAPILWP